MSASEMSRRACVCVIAIICARSNTTTTIHVLTESINFFNMADLRLCVWQFLCLLSLYIVHCTLYAAQPKNPKNLGKQKHSIE